ncbi:MAG: hypothetical protein P1P88_04985 [Bacteroidales bacterium]|nr:hypothetical protein [Bacteroidales bacterium]
MKKKKKTFVLMISEKFPAYHPRAGQETFFEDKIKSGDKIHTIRQNFALWKKRAVIINSGDGVLSIRKWAGKPYRSKHIELFRFEIIYVQKIDYDQEGWWSINHWLYRNAELAKNDGLSEDDFISWFKGCPDNLGCIIHFTDFKY